MKKVSSLIFTPFALLLLGLPVVCSSLKETSFQIVSASSQERNVLDELLAVPEFKTKYDLGFYNANPSLDEFDVLYAVENGYTGNNSYSLYLYVWNKSGKGSDYYVFDDQYNSVSIYDVTKASNNNYEIQFVNKSSDNLFIKYRVLVSEPNQFINDDLGSREYAITGIQIGHYYVGTLIRLTDYPVGKKWNFRSDESDTIVTYYDTFKYLELDVYGGAYSFSDESVTVQHHYLEIPAKKTQNLYYIWFNVPKLNVENNSLYSVHAEYYDFDLSNKIAVLKDEYSLEYYQELYPDTLTGNFDFYNDSQNEGFDDYQDDYIFHVWCDDIIAGNSYPARTSNSHRFLTGSHMRMYGQWNNLFFSEELSATEFLDEFPVLLNTNNVTDDFSGHLVGDMFDRQKAFDVSGQTKDEVYRNIHYCNQEREDSDAIDVSWDLISYGSQHSSFWNWLTHTSDTTFMEDLDCIEKIDVQDALISDTSFKSKYFVNNNDISQIKSMLNVLDDTYLFRFKLDDVISSNICYSNASHGVINSSNPMPSPIGYFAYEYHGVVDFDVLDLTFVDGEENLVNYPVVASPVNVFPDIPSPIESKGCSNFLNGLISILLILALILFIILFLKWFIRFMRYKKLERKMGKSGKSKRHSSHRNKKRKKGRKHK